MKSQVSGHQTNQCPARHHHRHHHHHVCRITSQHQSEEADVRASLLNNCSTSCEFLLFTFLMWRYAETFCFLWTRVLKWICSLMFVPAPMLRFNSNIHNNTVTIQTGDWCTTIEQEGARGPRTDCMAAEQSRAEDVMKIPDTCESQKGAAALHAWMVKRDEFPLTRAVGAWSRDVDVQQKPLQAADAELMSVHGWVLSHTQRAYILKMVQNWKFTKNNKKTHLDGTMSVKSARDDAFSWLTQLTLIWKTNVATGKMEFLCKLPAFVYFSLKQLERLRFFMVILPSSLETACLMCDNRIKGRKHLKKSQSVK